MLSGMATSPPVRTAAFFDLDKTIIARSSTLAFSRPFYQGGLINRRTVLRSAYAQFVYLVGGADHDQMERMRAYLSAMCTGWDVQQVKDIVSETLHELIDPIIYDEAATLIEEHHLAGRDVVIVSSSGAEVVEPIGEMLGADRVVATRMVVQDGHYTGDIDFYAYAENKAAAVRELAEQEGYDLPGCVRLQRLGHRRPDARGRRAPLRGQPRPGAAPRGGGARLAGPGVHQAGPVARPLLGRVPPEATHPGRGRAQRRCRDGRGGVARRPPPCEPGGDVARGRRADTPHDTPAVGKRSPKALPPGALHGLHRR